MSNQYTKGISFIYSNPELLDEWDYEKNVGISPENVARGSIDKYWWKCKKCGNSWPARPLARTRGSGCPYCSGRLPLVGVNDLATVAPQLIEEWDFKKNERDPSQYKPNSADKVWWKCSNCSYEWPAKISHRFRGSGCPFCAGKKAIPGLNDLQTLRPELAKEWHVTKNGSLKPTDVTLGSGKKVWWICKRGHVWKTAVHNRTGREQGCPFCGQSKQTSFPEQALLFYICQFFSDAKSREVIDKNELDIYIPSINTGIEYDGVFYHKNRIEKDNDKDKSLIEAGIRIIRVREKDLPVPKYSEYLTRDDDSYQSLETCISKIIVMITNRSDFEVDVSKDESKILDQFYSAKKENSLGSVAPSLIKEWHVTKNGDLTPFDIPAGSESKMWWKCSVCGHVWKAAVSHRVNGTGCPKCAKKQQGKSHVKNLLQSGIPSLQEAMPQLALEWDNEKNEGLSPADVTWKSNQEVWWRCNKCGHEWPARINRRVGGSGCPCCAREQRQRTLKLNLIKKKGSLQDNRPDIAIDWHPTKNGDLKPTDFLTGSHDYVWWKCHICGAEWKDSITHRTNGRTCRICRKTKKKSNPEEN